MCKSLMQRALAIYKLFLVVPDLATVKRELYKLLNLSKVVVWQYRDDYMDLINDSSMF